MGMWQSLGTNYYKWYNIEESLQSELQEKPSYGLKKMKEKKWYKSDSFNKYQRFQIEK